MGSCLDALAAIATTVLESINNDEWLGEARLRLTLTFLQHQISCENAERCSICSAKLDLYGIHADICVSGASTVLQTHGKWQIKEMFKAAASHIGAYISNVGGEETGIITGTVFMLFVMDVMGRLGPSAVEIICIASNGVSGSDDDRMKFRIYWTSRFVAAVRK